MRQEGLYCIIIAVILIQKYTINELFYFKVQSLKKLYIITLYIYIIHTWKEIFKRAILKY